MRTAGESPAVRLSLYMLMFMRCSRIIRMWFFGYDESGHAATMSYNGTTYCLTQNDAPSVGGIPYRRTNGAPFGFCGGRSVLSP